MIPDLRLSSRLSELFPVEQQTQAADVERSIEDRINYPAQRFTITCTSTTRPTNARVGDLIYETDTKFYMTYTGSYWISLSPRGAFIDALEATASTTYVDLTTPGPAVTVQTGPRALVLLSAHGTQSINPGNNFMAFALSGATTLAASDDKCALETIVGSTGGLSASVYVDSLTPGANTFTAKYRVNAGTGSFLRRNLIVVPLA